MGHWGLFGNQVIGGHREIATLLGTPRLPWMSDKPYWPAEDITGSQKVVCRTGGNGVDRLLRNAYVTIHC